MTHAEYSKLPGVNYSTLKHMARSPMHYLYATEHGTQPDTDAMTLGRVVHMAVFEPEKLATNVTVWEGTRRGNAWTEFVQAHDGWEIIKPGPFAMALEMAAAAKSAAGKLLSEGESEVTLQWKDPEYGIPMRGRLDHISRGHGIIDLKTCADASPLIFGARAASLQYHVQASLYTDGAEECGYGRLPYTLLAVENHPPFAAAIYTVTEDHLDVGRDAYRQWLSMLVACRRTNVWPSYAAGVLSMPAWAQPDLDEDASEFGLVFGGKDG